MAKQKENKGCAIFGVIGMVYIVWGGLGALSGNGFFESIAGNIKAAAIIAVVLLALWGAFSLLQDR